MKDTKQCFNCSGFGVTPTQPFGVVLCCSICKGSGIDRGLENHYVGNEEVERKISLYKDIHRRESHA